MPDIDFAPEFKTTTGTKYDRLNLKKDEKARVALLGQLKFAWTHTLRAPEFDDMGVAKTKLVKRRGVESTELDLGFIGRPLCIGDYGIIADKGIDKDNCPICEAADSEPEYFTPPEKRYGINIVRYATNRDGQLSRPFSCTCVVWTFADRVYNRITDIATEVGQSGKSLRDHDLLLTCTVESYQNYEIIPSMQAAWQANEDVKQRVIDTLRENGAEDVEGAIGRRTDKKWLPKDIDLVFARWAQHKGTTTPSRNLDDGTRGAETRNLTDELGGLLDDTKPAAQKPAAAPGAVDMDSMLNSLGEQPSDDKKPAAKTEDSLDFAKLLGDLS